MLIIKNPLLPDDYFLDCFVGGLKPHLKSFVKAFHPTTLFTAMEYARYQEETAEAIKNQDAETRPFIHSPKGIPPTPSKIAVQPNTNCTFKNYDSNYASMPRSSPRFIPPAERAEKIAKGLCY